MCLCGCFKYRSLNALKAAFLNLYIYLQAHLKKQKNKVKLLAIYVYTALQKFGNALEKWGFGQYWHESFLICDNFALIRDNTNYENIFYYINSLYIEKT